MLITLLIPTPGQARVLGRDVVEDARWVRERVGYVFGGDRGLYERLSALDNLRYFAELYGVEPSVQRTRIPSCSSSSASADGRRSGSRDTRAACGSGCTSRAACCTTRRCCCSTSRRSASTPSGRASCAG